MHARELYAPPSTRQRDHSINAVASGKRDSDALQVYHFHSTEEAAAPELDAQGRDDDEDKWEGLPSVPGEDKIVMMRELSRAISPRGTQVQVFRPIVGVPAATRNSEAENNSLSLGSTALSVAAMRSSATSNEESRPKSSRSSRSAKERSWQMTVEQDRHNRIKRHFTPDSGSQPSAGGEASLQSEGKAAASSLPTATSFSLSAIRAPFTLPALERDLILHVRKTIPSEVLRSEECCRGV
jgi:hypothetical protein